MSAALQQNPYLDELAFSGEKVRLGENFRLGVCVGEKLAANDCCIREKVRLTERCTSDREYYNYFRYYDPSTGRYITSDPIGLDGGLNTYGYAYQNPLLYTDPYGLVPPAAGRAAGAGTPGAPAGSPGGAIDWSQPWFPPVVTDAVDSIMDMAGRQTTRNPVSHNREDAILYGPPGNGCDEIEAAIRDLNNSIKWRKGDLNPSEKGTSNYVGHVKRIAILRTKLEYLKRMARNMGCDPDCE